MRGAAALLLALAASGGAAGDQGRRRTAAPAASSYCVVATLAGHSGSAGFADGAGTAASFSSPTGVALDPGRTAYVADAATHAVRRVTPAGVVSLLAGNGRGAVPPADGVGRAATFGAPQGVAFDSASGSLLVTDERANVLRRVTLAGAVSFVAGNRSGGRGYSDGLGAAAAFNQPGGVAVDAFGTAYVADFGNRASAAAGRCGVLPDCAPPFVASPPAQTASELLTRKEV